MRATERQREACAKAIIAMRPCDVHEHGCEMDATVDEALEVVRAVPLVDEAEALETQKAIMALVDEFFEVSSLRRELFRQRLKKVLP